MFWQEETNENEFVVPERVVDLLFQIGCSTLPVDHAWALSQQIQHHLPWFESEETAGLHVIHGAESGNGWERPQAADDLLYLSRRTKLILRLPYHRLSDAQRLSGVTLDVSGHELRIGSSKARKLSTTSILYSRHVAAQDTQDEEAFIARSVDQLKQAGLRFKKILCGKAFSIETPDGPLLTRSLMVADLPLEDAVSLQENGLGPGRSLGCGLFIPQKSF